MSSMGSRRGRQLSRTPRKRAVSSAYRSGSRVPSSLSSRSNSSRFGGTLWARPSSWGSKYRDPFPAVEKYQLRYCQTIQIDPGQAAATSSLFRANSIYDPDKTVGGHQPYGHDQLEQIYNHYCVDSATIVVTPTLGMQGVWGISVTDNDVVTSGFNTVCEQQATSMAVQSVTNGQPIQSLRKTYNRHTSFPVYKDTSAFMGSNPAEEAYFQIWYRGLTDSANPPTGTFLVSITYNVTCYELKDLGSS